MNGGERKAELLCAGGPVPSLYPVILRPAVHHPRFGNGETEVWELVWGTASSGRAGSRRGFSTPGSTRAAHASAHHPACKAGRRKCMGIGRVLPKAWQLWWEIIREPGTPDCTFYFLNGTFYLFILSLPVAVYLTGAPGDTL